MSTSVPTNNTAPQQTRLSGAQLQERVSNAPPYAFGWINARYELMMKVDELVKSLVDPIFEKGYFLALMTTMPYTQLQTLKTGDDYDRDKVTTYIYDLVAAGDFATIEQIATIIDKREEEDFDGEPDEDEETDEDEDEDEDEETATDEQ